jgi:hypothetical protein
LLKEEVGVGPVGDVVLKFGDDGAAVSFQLGDPSDVLLLTGGCCVERELVGALELVEFSCETVTFSCETVAFGTDAFELVIRHGV